MTDPLVSVVTPFRNTAPYLAECIESVLAQSHANFEYILSDNGSTDGSLEIAESFARRDPRIRLIRQPQLLSQVQHYNRALADISDSSRYCKMVQADDFIFSDCLRLMVQAFGQSETIGIVSSYDLKDNVVRGSGYPYPAPMLSGREVARLNLRSGIFPFGSPTTVMYRSSLVRSQDPFFDESRLHDDTEKCFQILQKWDFGFVHQVLSFMRVDNRNDSISDGVRAFGPDVLDRYIVVQRYGSVFLDAPEANALRKESRLMYYEFLSKEYLRRHGSAFWRYHANGLKTLDETIDRPYLTLQVLRRLASMVANPGSTVALGIRMCKKRMSRKRTKPAERSLQAVRIENPGI